MKNTTIKAFAMAVAIAVGSSTAYAHGGKHSKLHVNPKWKECSFQLDSSLTQGAWQRFTREAGLVAYFRPLTDAKPMGAGKFEFSILQWSTGINENTDAWNNTFVHPDSTHWLTGGEPLAFPGLMLRAGLTNKMDVGLYWTKNPNANYGFWGGQLQYAVVQDVKNNWAASSRFSFVSLYGPKDLEFAIYGVDLLASKTYRVFSKWAAVSPYAGVSAYLSSSHEKSNVVDLNDENTLGVQGMVGAVAQVSIARVAVEYNFARINSLSMKIGVSF